MKTLLSLTSRTFGKTRVRVFYKGVDDMKNSVPTTEK